MFHVGQKVVCISARMRRGHKRWPGQTYPVKGRIYTIRDTFYHGDGLCLILAEIVNSVVPGFRAECGFHSSRFRPIIERKTDISVFTETLAPTSIRELVEPTGH